MVPRTFHDAAMYAERADAVLTRVSGQDARKPWSKGNKGDLRSVHRLHQSRSRRAQCANGRRSGTHGVRNGAEEDVIARGIREAARREGLLLLQETQRWTCCERLSEKKKRAGNEKSR